MSASNLGLKTRLWPRSLSGLLYKTHLCLFFLLFPVTAFAQSLTDILPDPPQIRQLATGFGFTEGPAVDATGLLYFTDLGQNRIHTLDTVGTVDIFRTDTAGRANGLYFDRDGRLHACQGGTGTVTRTAADGSRTVLASQYEGARFNSPNDLVIAADGGLYFTDPFFGRSSDQPQPVQGVYRIGTAGDILRVVDDMTRPNGIILSPDGNTLFIADDGAGRIRAYDVQTDGTLTGGRDFATMQGISDGMTLDQQGNLYVAGGLRNPTSQGIWVFGPTGERLGIIPMPEMPTNCTFAGQTLYITAGTSVYSVDLLVGGAVGTAVTQSSWGQVKNSRHHP